MLTLYIKEFLISKGYRGTATSLRNVGMPVRCAYQLTGKDLKSIKLKDLEYLCHVFECTPNDLLNYQPEHKDLIDPGHPLNAIVRSPQGATPLALIKQLRPEEIREATKHLEEIIKKRKG